MTVGAGIGVGDRLEIHHVLPEISRLDARQELLRRVVHARVAFVRRRGRDGGGRPQSAGGYEAEQDEPRLRRSRARTMWHGIPPPRSGSQEVEPLSVSHQPGARTTGAAMPEPSSMETPVLRARPPMGAGLGARAVGAAPPGPCVCGANAARGL